MVLDLNHTGKAAANPKRGKCPLAQIPGPGPATAFDTKLPSWLQPQGDSGCVSADTPLSTQPHKGRKWSSVTGHIVMRH